MPAYHFIEDILRPWMRETQSEKKRKTLINEAYCAKVLERYFGDCYVSGSSSRRMKIIDGAMVDAFRERVKSEAKPKSERTIAEIIIKAGAACRYAITNKNYQMPNPFAGKAMSRQGRKKAAKSRRDVTDRGIWSKEDENLFIAHAPEFIGDVVKFALLTGLRLGEILDLVDEDEYEGERYQRIDGNEIIFSPMDQKSTFWGSCYMNEEALAILKKQTPLVRDGKIYRFAWEGKLLSCSNYNYYFRKVRDGINRPGLIFKNTRKTCGQRMLDAGADLEGVQAQLRHESILTTEGWYVRPAKNRAEQAVGFLSACG